MQLSKLLEKISEKYPDDEDVDMALTLSLETKGDEEMEEGDEELFPEMEEEDTMELDLEAPADEGVAVLDEMMGLPKKKKKKMEEEEY